MEKEQPIASMQKQIEELKHKAEQGSQQLQGEVLELDLESLLAAKFPRDTIEPVPKGEHGGDLLHRVIGPSARYAAQSCGKHKRTKNWSDGWLGKLREDQRAAKAEIAIIISQVLPKDVESFDWIDHVWVTHPRLAIPVAASLRQSLVELAWRASSRRPADQDGDGLSVPHRSALSSTGAGHRRGVLLHEGGSRSRKKVITKQWAKREEQIDRVMQATVGMYGDLQGIAGKSLQEIEGLELKALEDSKTFEEPLG